MAVVSPTSWMDDDNAVGAGDFFAMTGEAGSIPSVSNQRRKTAMEIVPGKDRGTRLSDRLLCNACTAVLGDGVVETSGIRMGEDN